MLARADIVPRIDPILLGLVIFVAVAGIALLMLGWIAALAVVVCEFGGYFPCAAHRRQHGASRGSSMICHFFLEYLIARKMLATGNSVQQALTRRDRENANPHMQRYLEPMIRRMQNGAAVGDSSTWLAERLDVLELHMFATAIQTNIRYGGRLSAAVLANLITVLRDRRARRPAELKAATSETRMSALILGALPIARRRPHHAVERILSEVLLQYGAGQPPD